MTDDQPSAIERTIADFFDSSVPVEIPTPS
jgi:hypothetical protein